MSKKKRNISLNDVYKKDYENKDSGFLKGARFLDISNYEGTEFYTIKKGRNEIDILPYEITTNNHPQGRKKGNFDYKLDIWAHRFINEKDHFVCLKKNFNKPCPICEEIKKMFDSDEYTKEDKVIQQLQPKRRVVYNVIDLKDDEQKVKLFETSHFEFQSEIIEEAESGKEGEFIPFADIEEGSSIYFRGVERKGEYKKSLPCPKGFKFVEREEAYDENILDEVFPLDALLVIPSYDEMKKAFVCEEENDNDDDEKENDNDDDDEEENDDDEEENDNDEEENDNDDDDEEEKTKKTKKNKSDNKKKKTTDNKCKAGGTFGKDCDELPGCEDCELWDACSGEFDKLNG